MVALKIKNYSTKQEVTTSLAQIRQLLRDTGVRDFTEVYDDDQRCEGIRFSLQTEMGNQQFQMLVDIAELHAALLKQWDDKLLPGVTRVFLEDRDQAERVALKNVVEWLHSNLSLAATKMHTPAQVLFGWMLNPADGEPIFDMAVARALPAPKENA